MPKTTRPPGSLRAGRRSGKPPRVRSTTPLVSPESVYSARRVVREMAASVGFTGIAIEELVLVVSELVSNAIKYAGGGHLEVTPLNDEQHGAGLMIAVEDPGPPFDLECALPDGHDASGQIDPARIFGRRGIGAGLGAVARLTEGVRLEPTERGKRLVAIRWLRRKRPLRR